MATRPMQETRSREVTVAPDRPLPRPRGRLRRILVGLAVCGGTLLALGVALEIAARVWFAKELTSFLPVYRVDDVAGYRFAPDISEYAFGARLETNSLGWRGPEWSSQKREGTLRIALIGDSLAFGFGVEWPDTMGEVLARSIEERTGLAAEVLNFGVPGYNSRQELAVLRQEAIAFEPDLVLVFLTSNDDDPELEVDAEGWLHWGDPEKATTRVDGEHRLRPDRWGWLRHSALLTWAKYVWSSYLAQRDAPPPDRTSSWMGEIPSGPVPSEIATGVVEPLLEMARTCVERDVPMAVLAFASGVPHRLAIREFAGRSGCPTLELLSLFDDVASDREWFEKYSLGWDSHPNAAAQARFAEGTLRLLERHGLLP